MRNQNGHVTDAWLNTVHIHDMGLSMQSLRAMYILIPIILLLVISDPIPNVPYFNAMGEGGIYYHVQLL